VQQEALRNLETARGGVASDIAKADGNLKQVSLKADAAFYAQQQNAEALLAERTATRRPSRSATRRCAAAAARPW